MARSQVKESGCLGHPVLVVAMHAPQSCVAFAFLLTSVDGKSASEGQQIS